MPVAVTVAAASAGCQHLICLAVFRQWNSLNRGGRYGGYRDHVPVFAEKHFDYPVWEYVEYYHTVWPYQGLPCSLHDECEVVLPE